MTITRKLDAWRPYAPVLLRIAISLVFLWFGLNQIFATDNFIGYLPEFLLATEYATLLVIGNGIFEVILGTLLLIGKFIRPVAAILGIHLLAITINLGYNDIAIRDAGLALATFAVALGGKDKWSLDK